MSHGFKPEIIKPSGIGIIIKRRRQKHIHTVPNIINIRYQRICAEQKYITNIFLFFHFQFSAVKKCGLEGLDYKLLYGITDKSCGNKL